MTLQQLFDYFSSRPYFTLGCLLFVPTMAWMLGAFRFVRGYEQPWRTVYAVLIYAACIPGIAALTLMVYLFLFERQSVWALNLLTQIAPIITMVATLFIASRNVDLNYIPGFDRLSGLMIMIAVLIVLMWIADKTRLIMFSYMPFGYVLALLVGLILLLNWGWRKATTPSAKRPQAGTSGH